MDRWERAKQCVCMVAASDFQRTPCSLNVDFQYWHEGVPEKMHTLVLPLSTIPSFANHENIKRKMKLKDSFRKHKPYQPLHSVVLQLEPADVLCASFEGETNEKDNYTPEGIEGVDRSEEFQFP